jgi:hypothetical protein
MFVVEAKSPAQKVFHRVGSDLTPFSSFCVYVGDATKKSFITSVAGFDRKTEAVASGRPGQGCQRDCQNCEKKFHQILIFCFMLKTCVFKLFTDVIYKCLQ